MEQRSKTEDESVDVQGLEVPFVGLGNTDSGVYRGKGCVVGTEADTLGQSHLQRKVRKDEAAGFELLREAGEAVGEGSHGLAGVVLEGAPILEVLPEPTGTGGVVEGNQVVPEFNPKVLLQKLVTGTAKEVVVDTVAATKSALVEKTSKVLGNASIGGSGGGVLQYIDGIGTPSRATDLGLEHALPFGEETFVEGELEIIRFGRRVEKAPSFTGPGVRGGASGDGGDHGGNGRSGSIDLRGTGESQGRQGRRRVWGANGATGPEGGEIHHVVNAKEGKLRENVLRRTRRAHGGKRLGGLHRVEEFESSRMAARGEALHIVHDEARSEASFPSKEEIFLEGPGDWVGASDLAPCPTVGNGVVGVTAGDLPTAIEAGGAMEVGVEDVEAVLKVVAEQGRKQRALEAVDVNLDADEDLGGLMEAKDE
jgi:hypothetical protein